MNEKRCIAAARTLLFNFNQGVWTPVSIFQDCCKLIDCDFKLKALPDFQPVEIPISFFSKEYAYGFIGLHSFQLFLPAEQHKFCSLSAGPKLNLLHNFTSMTEILCNFSNEEHRFITKILSTWSRPYHDIFSVPFNIARISTRRITNTDTITADHI